MPEIELSAGMIEYEDTGGSAPVVVLLHGLAMDGSVWRHVVRELRTDHRCVVPTMPLGSHRRPMRADADLSAHGIAKIQAEFLEALELREVTLVGSDSDVFQLTAGWYPEHIGRLVLTPCEAFENFPPGLPGRTAEIGIKMPGGTFLLAQALRWHALRRLPFTFGWMAKRPIPNEIVDAWLRPAQTQRYLPASVAAERQVLAHPSPALSHHRSAPGTPGAAAPVHRAACRGAGRGHRRLAPVAPSGERWCVYPLPVAQGTAARFTHGARALAQPGIWRLLALAAHLCQRRRRTSAPDTWRSLGGKHPDGALGRNEYRHRWRSSAGQLVADHSARAAGQRAGPGLCKRRCQPAAV